MSEAIVISSCLCKACGFTFTSGAPVPTCPRCNATDIERTGTAASLSVPDPVPAGDAPDDETMRAQVKAAAGTTQPVSYRCPEPGCTFTVSWSPLGDPPRSITDHEMSHAAGWGR